MAITFDSLIGLLQSCGGEQYHGEAVTQLQHALQCAAQAERASKSKALIAAALFHDIGHLAHRLGEDASERGIDDRHEDLGAAMLRQVFSPDVSEPVRLHVMAKRFLCHTNPAYEASLSEASVLSLQLQGGAFDAGQAHDFLSSPHADAAVQLRHWDDLAKNSLAVTPELGHYAQLLRS